MSPGFRGAAKLFSSISDFVYSALKSEEPDRAFAFSEWKSPGIFQHPSPVTAKLPFRRMRLYAIDYIDDAHDSAELEFSREPEAILLCDRRKILRRCERAIAAGMNEKRTPMICSPSPILYIFVTVNDQPSPRLPNRQSTNLFQFW